MPETARVSDVGDELALVPCASATADGVPVGAGCSDDDSIDGDLLLALGHSDDEDVNDVTAPQSTSSGAAAVVGAQGGEGEMAGVNPRGHASASAPDVADKLRQQKKEYQLQKKAATAKPTMSFGQNRQLAQIIDEPSPAFDKAEFASDQARQQAHKDELARLPPSTDERCKYSAINFKERVVPAKLFDSYMQGRNVVRIDRLRSRPPSGDWVTIGVLTSRAQKAQVTSKASGSKSFLTWRLSDLSREGNILLMLFGAAYEQFWKEYEGIVVAVLNPTLIPDPGDGKGDGTPRFKVSDAGQLLKMGRSKDFGKCKALRNDGQPCQMCVNKAITQYCEYHVGAAHKKLNAKRPNLQNWQGAPGNTMSVQQKKELQESSKKGLLTGARTDSHGNKIHPGRQQIQNELDARIRSHGEDGNRRKGFGQASSFKATPTLRQSEEGRRKVMDTMSKARVGGKPSIAFAHMAQAEKLNEATRQKGVPLTQIKPSGPAPASVPKGKDAPSRISSSSGMKGVGVQKPEHNRFEVQRASECTDSLTSEPKERGSGDGANATETADGKDVFVHLNKAGGAGSAAQKVLQQIKEDQAKEDQRKAAAKKERLAAAARRDGSGVKSAASVGNSAGVNRPQSAAGKGHQANTVLRWEENAKNKDKRKREDDTLKSWVHKEKAKTHDAQDDTKKRRVERGPEVGGISARGASAQGMKGAELSSKPLPKIPHKGEKPEPKPWGKGGFGGEAGTTLRLHVCTNECEDEAGHSLQTTHLCVLCRVVLCSACSNQHRTAKLTRDHNLIDLKQAAKQRAHEEGGMEPIRNAGVPSAATATAVVHSGASLRNGDDTTVEANSTKVSEADVAHALGPAAVAAARNADEEEADDEDELSLIATDSSGQQFFRTEQDVASEAAFESPRQKMDDDEAEDEIVFEETDRPALAPEEGKHQGDDDSAIGDEEGMSDFSARKRLRQVGSSDDECSGKEGASDAEEDGVHGRAVEVSCLETETDLRAQQAIRRAQSVIDNRPFYENKDKRRKVIVSESEGEPGSGSESESIGQVEAAEAGGEDSNGPWTAKIHHKILQHGHSTAKDSGDSSSCFRGSCSVREGGAREEAKVEDADQGESQLIIDDKKVAAVDDSEKERDFSSPGRFHRQLQSRAARAAQEPELKPLPLPSAACAATASDREGSIGTGALSLPCTKPTPVTTKKRTMVVTEEGADKNFAEQVVSESAMMDRKMAAQQLAQAGVKLGSSGNQEGMTREDAAARERANEARKRELEDDKARKDAARRRCLKIAPGADTLGEEGAGVGGCSDDDDDGTLELGWVATVDAVKGVKSVVASGPRKSGLSGKFAHVAAKLNTEEGRRTLESGSRHASLAKEEVEARKEQKMDKLHEQCQLAMMSEATFEEQCSIFTCDECVPTVRDWRPPPCCKTASKGGKGHSWSKTTGKKYWFECGSCKTRDAAIALVGPNFDCFRCGARDWRRSTKSRSKEIGPAHDFKIRGDEGSCFHAFTYTPGSY